MIFSHGSENVKPFIMNEKTKHWERYNLLTYNKSEYYNETKKA